MKKIGVFGLLLCLFALGAAQETSEAATVTVTLKNVGASAWTVLGVEGADGVADLNTDNPTLTLVVGMRYTFDVSGVNSSIHPLDFRAADGTVLLAQSAREGSFEMDEAVTFEADENKVSFTLTPELADVMATYHCSVHGVMTGLVDITTP